MALCSAGDTLFLSGGTHTITGGTAISVTSKVNIIGGGPDTTFITGDSEDFTGILKFYGDNLIEGCNIVTTGSDSSCCIETLTTGPSNLVVKNCKLSGDGDTFELNDPASGRTKVTLIDCYIKAVNDTGIVATGAIDLVVENCQFEQTSSNNSTQISVTTQDATVIWKNSIVHAISSTGTALSLSSTGTGDIVGIIEDSAFTMAASYLAVFANETSTGIVTVHDCGGNSFTETNVGIGGSDEGILISEGLSQLSTDLYVNPNQASDNGDGLTPSTAKETFAAALALASAGYTIHLSAGTHTIAQGAEQTLIDGITVVGAGPELTTVTGDPNSGTVSIFLTEGTSLIEGINFVKTGAGRLVETGTTAQAISTIRNCSFDNSGGSGEALYIGGNISARNKVTVEDCRFELSADDGIEMSDENIDLVVRNCTFEGAKNAVKTGTITTHDITTKIDNCSIQVSGSVSGILFTCTGTGSVEVGLINTTFHVGTGYGALLLNTSSGHITIYDGGGNNLDEVGVDNTGGTVVGQVQTVNTISSKLPTAGALIAGEGTNIKNLDDIPTGARLLATGKTDAIWNAGTSSQLVYFFTGHVASDDYFNNCLIVFADGQSRYITAYDESDPDITVDRPINVTIADQTNFSIYDVMNTNIQAINDSLGNELVLYHGLDAGGTTTVTLGSVGPSAVDDFYNGCLIVFHGGAAEGQTRYITNYVGSTRVTTLDKALETAADGNELVRIYIHRQTNLEAITDKLPSASAQIAGEGTTAKNLDEVILNATQDATWAANLVKSAGVMVAGTATGGTQTTLIDTSLSDQDDTYNDRIVMFLTGNLTRQAAAISDYDSGTTTFTISQVTEAPQAGDTYIVI
jgi:hypothetical protein